MEAVSQLLGINTSNKKPHELDISVDELKHKLKEAKEKAGARDTSIPYIVNGYIPNPNVIMKAVEFQGKESVKLGTREAPSITQPFDAVVRVTSTTICGSDLHFYFDAVPGRKLDKGYILGHESVGYVQEVGPDVKNIKKGDRVVLPFPISCGECSYCKQKMPTLCDRSNPEPDSQVMFGAKLAGLFGYGYSTGAFAGQQAEYVRVPVADVNLLKVPENVKDSQILGLSDILCTAWHGLELGNVDANTTVVIWGVGPVGLAAIYLAKKLKGTKRILAIDFDEQRLQVAQQYGAEILARKNVNVKEKVLELFPGGQDVSIDCTGEWFKAGIIHTIAEKVLPPHDPSEVNDEMIYTTRKGGNISLIRAYFAYALFPLGLLMEKSITVRGGQAYVHRYWQYLLDKIVDGTIDPSWIFSHVTPFENAEVAYKKFAQHEEGVLKYLLHTQYGREKHGPNPHTGNPAMF